jgi:hypothetical protein
MKLASLVLALLFSLPAWAQAPVIGSISPDHVLAGSGDITLSVNGTHFSSSPPSVIVFNGANLSTTRLSAQLLTATVSAARLAAIGSFTVTVSSSAVSNAVRFRVLTPLASITSYSPTVFSPVDTPITVYGSDFNSTATILFDWQAVTTTFVSAGELTGTISGTLISSSPSTTHHILVYNGAFTAASIGTLDKADVIGSGQPQLSISNVVLGTSLTGTAVISSLQGIVTLGSPFYTISGTDSADFAQVGGTCANGMVLRKNASCSIQITGTPSGFPAQIPGWTAENAYALNDVISDNANRLPNVIPHLQKATTAGTSGDNSPGLGYPGVPNWDESGGTTTEGPDTLVWTDQGPYTISFSESATLTVNSNAANNPQSIPLGMTKTYPAVGYPSLLVLNSQMDSTGYDFGSVTESTPTARAVTLVNAGANYMDFATPFYTVTGTDAADFVLSGSTCADGQFLNSGSGYVNAPGQSCGFILTFTPSTTAAESAILEIDWTSIGGTVGSIMQNLTGTGTMSGTKISLAWTASDSASVTGYKVYRGTQVGGPYSLLTSLGNVTSYDDTTPMHGNTYCYVVAATGPNPPYTVESSNSLEACATF